MPSDSADYIFDQRDTNIVEHGFNPLPRSVVRRTPYELLNGEWRFALDPEDHGLKDSWYLGHDFAHAAQFPGAIESHLERAKAATRATHDPAPDLQERVVAWYEREFSLPAEWGAVSNRLTQLTFGACGYETRVWLNGHPLKTIEGEEAHLGEYNSFSYELPRAFLQLFNRLTIRISDSLDAEIPRGKQQSHVYKQGGIWYQTISGAVRSVWIEPVERNRLRSRLNVVSSLGDRVVEFDLTTRTHVVSTSTTNRSTSRHTLPTRNLYLRRNEQALSRDA